MIAVKRGDSDQDWKNVKSTVTFVGEHCSRKRTIFSRFNVVVLNLTSYRVAQTKGQPWKPPPLCQTTLCYSFLYSLHSPATKYFWGRKNRIERDIHSFMCASWPTESIRQISWLACLGRSECLRSI